MQYEPSDRIFSVIKKLDRQLIEWLKKRHIKSFYVSVANPSLRVGAQNLIQVVELQFLDWLFDQFSFLQTCYYSVLILQISGLGKLRPNILILGFKANWAAQGAEELDGINNYFGIIQ